MSEIIQYLATNLRRRVRPTAAMTRARVGGCGGFIRAEIQAVAARERPGAFESKGLAQHFAPDSIERLCRLATPEPTHSLVSSVDHQHSVGGVTQRRHLSGQRQNACLSSGAAGLSIGEGRSRFHRCPAKKQRKPTLRRNQPATKSCAAGRKNLHSN